MEKLTLALIHAARRVRHYFHAHPMQVLTDQPIRQVLSKPERSGRMAKWVVELGEHYIEYRTRISTKGQSFATFLAEIPHDTDAQTTLESHMKDQSSHQDGHQEKENIGEENCWILFTNGASNNDKAGAGLVLTSPSGETITYTLVLTSKLPKMSLSMKPLLRD